MKRFDRRRSPRRTQRPLTIRGNRALLKHGSGRDTPEVSYGYDIQTCKREGFPENRARAITPGAALPGQPCQDVSALANTRSKRALAPTRKAPRGRPAFGNLSCVFNMKSSPGKQDRSPARSGDLSPPRPAAVHGKG